VELEYNRINQTIYDEYKSLNCSYWYRDLITQPNSKRCDDILENVIWAVFYSWNRYDLLQGIPSVQTERLDRFLVEEA